MTSSISEKRYCLRCLGVFVGYFSNELEKGVFGKLSVNLAWAGPSIREPSSYTGFLKMIAGLDLSFIICFSDENLLMVMQVLPLLGRTPSCCSVDLVLADNQEGMLCSDFLYVNIYLVSFMQLW